MAETKPLVLYGGKHGPNPMKVSILLHELALPYTVAAIDFSNVKSPEYLAINPNGRIPALHDPNTELTLWESGAIVEYLIATYDKDNKLSFSANSAEDWACKQYLYFQVSGQGPYYGQARWFDSFHPEKIPSAIERYYKEIKRVTAVLEKVLEGKEWLVGGKCTYADLAFIPWQGTAEKMILKDWDWAGESPNVVAWMERMKARPGVKEVLG